LEPRAPTETHVATQSTRRRIREPASIWIPETKEDYEDGDDGKSGDDDEDSNKDDVEQSC
jgi:hypothetical protein